MTTATLSRRPTTDWSARPFALITTWTDERYGVFATGHDDPTCPLVDGTPAARDCSADDAGLPMPWPCRCVPVERRAHEIGFEAARRDFADQPVARPEPRPEPSAEEQARTNEAVAYARGYTGDFEFMCLMAEKAKRPAWTPTEKMTSAILRCKVADAARGTHPPASPSTSANPIDERRVRLSPNAFAGSCHECGGWVEAQAGCREKLTGGWVVRHRTVAECEAVDRAKTAEGGSERAIAAPGPAPLPDIPAGRYAVENAEGVLRFYEVDRPEPPSRWAGRTFVSVLASDERHPVKGEGGRAVLAKIAEDPRSAMLRYGHEIGACGRCGKLLTDEESRRIGIGPVCIGKLGW